MKPRAFVLACSSLFSIVAAAHVARLVLGWDVSIGGWAAPRWISFIGVAIPGALSTWGFSLARRAAAH